ncbi:YjbF family lipoprotein [Photobacterium chitinilyticum]|uniref:YjbF family lipoprotein n=1 Tax=Photobacterium chitinilyticum TaxID=2485123 RepID=UPI003D0E5461
MRIITQFNRFLLCLMLALVSSGCSQKFNDVSDTMSLAFFGNDDTSLSNYDITNLPYASIYARVNNGPQAFMVLAIAQPITRSYHATDTSINTQLNPIQLKWMSADRAMLVTESGRIVKTVNLPNANLTNSYSDQPDPLMLGLHRNSTPTYWHRYIDWQPGYHSGYTLSSSFTFEGKEVIKLNESPVETLHFSENVSVKSLDESYINHFWINPNNGKVLKSLQILAPGQPYIEITLLKPYS